MLYYLQFENKREICWNFAVILVDLKTVYFKLIFKDCSQSASNFEAERDL